MSSSSPASPVNAAAHATAAVDFDQLTFSEVSRYFGRRRALARVSFTCRTGEVVALLGPNGAGKSTVLGLAASTLQPSAGEIRYGAHRAAEAGPGLRARIGMLAHELQLYPELTARENLEFFASLFGIADPRARAAAALDRADLGARGDDLVGGFSRGMRQRIALERALLHEPRLVLLDEPFTGLDERSSAGLAERLQTLKSQDCIILMTTHDFEAAEGVVDGVVLLRAGRVATMAPPGGSLRERYRASMRDVPDARPGSGAGP